jgi:serine/threonine protein kinase
MWVPGQSVDRFYLERIIGHGGFGITFLARDTSQTKPTYCVIKTLKKELPDFATQQAKFRQEALNLAKCSHPHVVAVLDVIFEDGIWGLVMDYVDGESLFSVVRGHRDERLPEAEALRYVDQVAQALDCVHDRGLLHRDVKPLNIMVSGNTGAAILIDFGLARDFSFDDSRSMTAMMTEGFAPIEQYGRRGVFGPGTDIYALAATLYFMLTGEGPLFNAKGRKEAKDGGNALDNFMWDKLKALGVSDRVQKAIIWGMEVNAVDRPRSVQEWREALKLVGRAAPQIMPLEPINSSSGTSRKELQNQGSIPYAIKIKTEMTGRSKWRLISKRFIAFAIDLLVLASIVMGIFILCLLISALIHSFTGSYFSSGIVALFFISAPASCILYFAFYQSLSIRPTIGERFLKVSVTNLRGDKITFLACIWRLFLTIGFLGLCVFGIGLADFITALFRKDGRFLHDILSGTKAVERDC